MEEVKEKVYYIPVKAFIDDISRCGIKGVNNKTTNILREKALHMLSAFWVIQTTGLFFPKKEKGVWIASGVAKVMGSHFDDNFIRLRSIKKSRYARYLSAKRFEMQNGAKFIPVIFYEIKTSVGSGSHIDCVAVKEGSELYKGVTDILNNIQKYLENKKDDWKDKISDNKIKVAERCFTLHMNKNEVSEILKESRGFSFNEADFLMSGVYDNKTTDEYLKYSNVMYIKQLETIVDSFNSGTYQPTFKYERMYTPVCSFPKEIRKCLYNSKNERMVEVYDMKGAHVVGSMMMCASLAKTEGEASVSEKFMNYVIDASKDPYRFAMKGVFERDRESAKDAVMAYVFADSNLCKHRGLSIMRMKDCDNYETVLKACKQFIDIYDTTYNIKNFPSKVLKNLFNKISFSSDVLYVITGHSYKNISFSNAEVSYESLDNALAKKDMLKGNVNLSVFAKAVKFTYNAMLQYHVECCIKEEFGLKSLLIFEKVKQHFQEKSDKLVFLMKEFLKKRGITSNLVSSRELAKGNTPNASVMNQVAEGWTMFDNIVPWLVDVTGCEDIITLHDAIIVPESIVHKINVKELNMKVVSMFIMNVEYAFKHIDAYFNGETEAPFSYVA